MKRTKQETALAPSLLFLLLAFCCAAASAQTRTYNGDVFELSGKEVWSVGGRSQAIEGCMIVPMRVDPQSPEIQYLFAIRAEFARRPSPSDRPVALAIARYAFDHAYFEMAERSLKELGIAVPLNRVIGVALIAKDATLFGERAQGYRFQFTLDELR